MSNFNINGNNTSNFKYLTKGRILPLVLSCTLAVSAFTGCGKKAGNDYKAPEEALVSDIYVEPVQGISDEFIRGVDISEVIAEENSGVKYYNFNGEEQDVLKTLADAGVNCVRIRVWNNPYDENGNPYGGGNNDVDTALALGKRATDYGMKVLIDFHYSDFWADPSRQLCPKAWKGMDIDDKADALNEFTYETLKTLKDGGVDVSMVQIGNEINTGLAGETKDENIMQLLKAGLYAVSDFNKDKKTEIKTIVHYTNAGDYEEMEKTVNRLKDYGVEYDIFGVSYYPYWHGSFEKISSVLKNIHNNHGKDVMVVETAYPFTTEDSDCYGNSESGQEPYEGYASTLQGQASIIRDVCAVTKEAGGLGVFYWGGTWISVGDNYESNKTIWQEKGSGWATSYASGYDPKNVGNEYGGCSWDNQALFDKDGKPLETLNVFKYLKYGTITEDKIDYVPDYSMQVTTGKTFVLPATIPAIHYDRNLNADVHVAWNEDDIKAVNKDKEGEYIVRGTAENGSEVKCTVNVGYINLLLNPSFEDHDTSMWIVESEGSNPSDYQEKAADAHSGDFAFHFWSESDMNFSIEQTLEGLEAGTYNVSVFSQGGDMNNTALLELYAIVDGVEYVQEFADTGWADWKNPKISGLVLEGDTITVGVRFKCNARSWGTIDDFTVCKID